MLRFPPIVFLLFFVFPSPAFAAMSKDAAPAPSGHMEASPAGNLQTGPPPDWRKVRELTLSTALRIALSGNPSLSAAAERVIQATERTQQAKAAYWPKLDSTFSASRLSLSETARRGALSTGIENPDESYQAVLSADWLLFDGFERKYSLAAARYGENERISERWDLARLLFSSVAAFYYNAQLTAEQILIAEADLSFNRRQITEAEARLAAGTGSLSDRLNFEVQVNRARDFLIGAKKNYEVSLLSLAALLGIGDPAFAQAVNLPRPQKESAEEMRLPVLGDLIAYAGQNRPDLLSSGFALERAESGIGAAKAAFFPDIFLSAGLSGERRGDAGISEEDFGSNVSLNLTYNLFSGGADRSKVAEATSRRHEAQELKRDVAVAITGEVGKSLSGLSAAQRKLLLQRSNAALVLENRDLVEKEYAAGQTSLVRLNEAQRDLVEAEALLAQSLLSMRLAWYNLRTSTGESIRSFNSPETENDAGP